MNGKASMENSAVTVSVCEPISAVKKQIVSL